MISMRYCESPYFYQRRKSREVIIGDPARGGIIVGGDHPVVKQSMLTCDTMDTATCVTQTLELVEAGCQLVRITAPTVKAAANLQHIVAELRARGCHVPIVADIHFKPEAAMEAAKWVEANPAAAARLSVEKKYLASTVEQNAVAISHLRYVPSVSGAETAVKLASLPATKKGVSCRLNERSNCAAMADTARLLGVSVYRSRTILSSNCSSVVRLTASL